GNHAPLRGYWQCGKQRHSTNPPTPLPVGERPTSRASEMSGEGSSCSNPAPHPVCSLRSQTTLSPSGERVRKAGWINAFTFLTASSREAEPSVVDRSPSDRDNAPNPAASRASRPL